MTYFDFCGVGPITDSAKVGFSDIVLCPESTVDILTEHRQGTYTVPQCQQNKSADHRSQHHGDFGLQAATVGKQNFEKSVKTIGKNNSDQQSEKSFGINILYRQRLSGDDNDGIHSVKKEIEKAPAQQKKDLHQQYNCGLERFFSKIIKIFLAVRANFLFHGDTFRLRQNAKAVSLGCFLSVFQSAEPSALLFRTDRTALELSLSSRLFIRRRLTLLIYSFYCRLQDKRRKTNFICGDACR